LIQRPPGAENNQQPLRPQHAFGPHPTLTVSSMHEAIEALQMEAAVLLAATIICVVFFLIARVGRARQSVALAFALMPIFLTYAAQGLAGPATALF
jgi:hypothetical protein